MDCEMLGGCGFFNDYKGCSEVVKNGFTRMYCKDKAKSDTCQRKAYKAKNGAPPVKNMAPTGSMLPE